MIELQQKYLFKKLNSVATLKFSIFEDPFGHKHNLPIITTKDTIELLYSKKQEGKDIFTQLECEFTNYVLDETYSLQIINAKKEQNTNRVAVTIKDIIGRDFWFFVPETVYEKVKPIGLIKCKVKSILGEKIIFRHAEFFSLDYKENINYDLEI